MNVRHVVGRLTLTAIACSLCALACHDPSQPDRIPVVQLAPHTPAVTVGDSLTLFLLPVLPPGYVPSVDWTSSNPAVASVHKAATMAGTVRGLSPGQAVITVGGSGASDSTLVTVAASGG